MTYSACTECGNEHFQEHYREGDVVCSSCGVVLPERLIDFTEEHRIYEDTTFDPHRGELLHPYLQQTLTTFVRDTSSNTSSLGSAQSKLTFQRDKILLRGFERITHLAELMQLNNRVVDKAKELCKSYQEKATSIPQQKLDYFVASLLFLACQASGVPRTLLEISCQLELDLADIRKQYKAVRRVTEPAGLEGAFVSASGIIDRVCCRLKLDFQTSHIIHSTCERVEKHLEGKPPASVAATALLLCLDHFNFNYSPKDACKAAGVRFDTIKRHLREIETFRSRIFLGLNISKKPTASKNHSIIRGSLLQHSNSSPASILNESPTTEAENSTSLPTSKASVNHQPILRGSLLNTNPQNALNLGSKRSTSLSSSSSKIATSFTENGTCACVNLSPASSNAPAAATNGAPTPHKRSLPVREKPACSKRHKPTVTYVRVTAQGRLPILAPPSRVR